MGRTMRGRGAEAGPMTGHERRLLRVMVVDDDPLVRHEMARWLEGRGLATVVADTECCDGLVEMAADLRADIVLLDLDMPGRPAMEVLGALRALPQPPAVYIVSGECRESVVMGALAAGAAGYVLKDDAPAGLEVALRAASSGRRYLSPTVLAVCPRLLALTAPT